MTDAAVATLIGDLVGSRSSQDRAVLHQHLDAALAEVNDLLHPLRPLWITAGDEYQGSFATVAEAVQATLLVRVRLLPAHDIRHGIGWGPTTVLDEETGVEDGPGWWAARAGIEAAARAGDSPAQRWLRTAYVVADGAVGAPDPGLVNAALVLRDERVSGLSARSVSVLRGLLSHVTQRDVADALGITASAVSQRVRADGLAAIVAAHDLLTPVGGHGEEGVR
ncbi:SatD family protein [Nocardioides pinisoli]|uniref:SatD family protein n=1 Tax=Nocardioides pinisoli TaxID=2950279 RepID=A0ABT1L2C5_9ACTN|nr:SatD family protein [Nocardioides pinisoli]MCP3424180.1 SatD family protein [Nocardioides pinisoli]